MAGVEAWARWEGRRSCLPPGQGGTVSTGGEAGGAGFGPRKAMLQWLFMFRVRAPSFTICARDASTAEVRPFPPLGGGLDRGWAAGYSPKSAPGNRGENICLM